VARGQVRIGTIGWLLLLGSLAMLQTAIKVQAWNPVGRLGRRPLRSWVSTRSASTKKVSRKVPLISTGQNTGKGISSADSPSLRPDSLFIQQTNAQENVRHGFVHVPAPPSVEAVKKWVVFSDLHVKSTSVETCERVLDLVHDEALKRQAGIVFLGDFWHVRGAVSVELLNRVLKCLRRWSQPTIMIPGR
jgi:hypothetical protein